MPGELQLHNNINCPGSETSSALFWPVRHLRALQVENRANIRGRALAFVNSPEEATQRGKQPLPDNVRAQQIKKIRVSTRHNNLIYGEGRSYDVELRLESGVRAATAAIAATTDNSNNNISNSNINGNSNSKEASALWSGVRAESGGCG